MVLAVKTRGLLLSCVSAALGLGGCSSDIFDVDVAFTPQSYDFDFGAEAGEVPAVACDVADDPCAGVAVELSGAETLRAVRVGCNQAAGQCYVQADAELAVTLSVLEQSDFPTKVRRRGVALVRTLELGYAVPVNTLTFDLPQVDLFVGPDGTRHFDDPGVVYVDSIRPVPAGEQTPLPTRHLTIADRSPARDLLQAAVMRQEPFVFVLAMSPRVLSGQPIPAGQLAVELFPRMRLGIPE